MFFVSVLNRLCDVKHMKSTHKWFQTRASRVDFGSLDEDSSATFGQIHDVILCVSTPIVGELEAVGVVFGW